MKDRVSLNPGRVLVTPEDGSSAFYATLTRADNPTQDGDPLNKNTLMKDATAALFGLGNNAVPNDVLAYLGKYNQHWWSILHGQETIQYIEKRTNITVNVDMNHGTSRNIQYSHEVSIDQSTGAVSLLNPQTFNIPRTTDSNEFLDAMQNLLDLAPVYVSNLYDNASSVYYIPAGAYIGTSSGTATSTITHSYYGDYKRALLNKSATNIAKIITSEMVVIPAGEITYENSANRNAYPDSGTVDGLTYEYLGVPFSNAVNSIKMSVGMYAGTGTYGADNPNSLTFDFVPKLVFVFPAFEDIGVNALYWIYDMTIVGSIAYISSSSYYSNLTFSLSDKTLSWYSTKGSAESDTTAIQKQCNTSGKIYYFVGIG